MGVRLYVPKTLKEAKKEIERQQKINLKYADLFEQRENELKAEIQQHKDKIDDLNFTITSSELFKEKEVYRKQVEAAKTICKDEIHAGTLAQHVFEEILKVLGEQTKKESAQNNGKVKL